jgi:hypothetical protein
MGWKEKGMSEANKIQVGGDHYKQDGKKPEHWDLAILYQWDPFQYQITKYVMRWKYKHSTPEKRLEDLKKARHFLDKYIENYEAYDTHEKMDPLPTIEFKPVAVVDAPEIRPTMGADSDNYFTNEGYYGDNTQLYKCRFCRIEVRAKNLGEAHKMHDACALVHSYFSIP